MHRTDILMQQRRIRREEAEMQKVIEREELYRQVWTIPMSRLCRQYGLSDNGLRKVCKALSVPMPRAGHWAKLEVGKADAAPPLSTSASRTTYVVDSTYRRKQPSPLRDELAAELMRKIALERVEQKHTDRPRRIRWHNAMTPLLALVRERRSFWKAQEREYKAVDARRKAGFPPEVGGYLWRSFLESGGLLFPKHRRFVMKVTETTCDRSLAILNLLCSLATRRGYEVHARGEECDAMLIKLGEATVSFRILEKIVASQQRDDSFLYRDQAGMKRVFKPAGVLKLHVDSPYAAEKIFEEAPDIPLEALCGKVMIYVHTMIARQQERSRLYAEAAVLREEMRRVREAEYAVQEVERQRVAAELAERRRLEEMERERQGGLIEDATRWRQAQDLRQYIEAVECRARESGEQFLIEAWSLWARGVLGRLDPVSQLLLELREKSRYDSGDGLAPV